MSWTWDEFWSRVHLGTRLRFWNKGKEYVGVADDFDFELIHVSFEGGSGWIDMHAVSEIIDPQQQERKKVERLWLAPASDATTHMDIKAIFSISSTNQTNQTKEEIWNEIVNDITGGQNNLIGIRKGDIIYIYQLGPGAQIIGGI